MDGGLNFGGFNAKKYLDDVKGQKRMAGDIFQPTFGDQGWNEDFVNTNAEPLEVDRAPALDWVAAEAKKAERKKELKEMGYDVSNL